MPEGLPDDPNWIHIENDGDYAQIFEKITNAMTAYDVAEVAYDKNGDMWVRSVQAPQQ